ncbi:MAG: hypothetical protein ACSHXD_20615 [Marinosulfonomonas sp.]
MKIEHIRNTVGKASKPTTDNAHRKNAEIHQTILGGSDTPTGAFGHLAYASELGATE